jgi:alginate O-acetyltransferase complex protein AlgI
MFCDYTSLFLFLPAALLIHFALPGRYRNAWLFLASLIFYGLYNLRFLPLLILSAFATYFLGLAIAGSKKNAVRKFWLVASLLLSLGVLAAFKYTGMFSETVRKIPAFSDFPLIKYALPLGISFYTFKNISYLVDIYRRQVEPARSLIDYSMYLTFFPQLPSGPIMRFKEIAGQLHQRPATGERIGRGIQLFFMGASKKILLADSAAFFCNPLFALPVPGFWQSWASVLLYSAQIYFDFSGYTDMAIGLAFLFGIESPQNFNSPYKSHSFAQFWRRWHMTLSFWLRDYLYISLGGNREGKFRTYLNLFLTMLLGGLWHGASWNFLVWGGYHGLILGIER